MDQRKTELMASRSWSIGHLLLSSSVGVTDFQVGCWQQSHWGTGWRGCKSTMLTDKLAVDISWWLTDWQVHHTSSNRFSKLPRSSWWEVIMPGYHAAIMHFKFMAFDII